MIAAVPRLRGFPVNPKAAGLGDLPFTATDSLWSYLGIEVGNTWPSFRNPSFAYHQGGSFAPKQPVLFRVSFPQMPSLP